MICFTLKKLSTYFKHCSAKKYNGKNVAYVLVSNTFMRFLHNVLPLPDNTLSTFLLLLIMLLNPAFFFSQLLTSCAKKTRHPACKPYFGD